MPNWYVVLCKPQREADVCVNLKRQGYGVFFPRQWITTSKKGHATSELKPFFPRYLFVMVDDGQSVMAVNSTHGVSTVLFVAGEAYALPSDALWALRALFDPDGVMPPGSRSLKHIRKVIRQKLHLPMFEDMLDEIERIDDKGFVRLQRRSRSRASQRSSLPVLHRKPAELSHSMANCGADAI